MCAHRLRSRCTGVAICCMLTRGEALYPGNPYAGAGLAKEYSQRGAHDRAIELAESVVRDHPEYGYGPLALAEVYIHAGRFEEGRVWLDRVNPDYSKSEVGMAGLAGLYGQMGDYERAFALCSEILEKEPNLYSALYNCGNIHLMDGQYREAEQLLSRAVQLVPEQAAPKHFLGRALLQDGRNAEAQSYLLQAAAMDPKVWDYHYWLAVSFEEQREYVCCAGRVSAGVATEPEQQRSEDAADGAGGEVKTEMENTPAKSGMRIGPPLSVEIRVHEQCTEPVEAASEGEVAVLIAAQGWLVRLTVLAVVLADGRNLCRVSHWPGMGTVRRRGSKPKRAAGDAGTTSASRFCGDLHRGSELYSCAGVSSIRCESDVAAHLCVSVFSGLASGCLLYCAALYFGDWQQERSRCWQ